MHVQTNTIGASHSTAAIDPIRKTQVSYNWWFKYHPLIPQSHKKLGVVSSLCSYHPKRSHDQLSNWDQLLKISCSLIWMASRLPEALVINLHSISSHWHKKVLGSIPMWNNPAPFYLKCGSLIFSCLNGFVLSKYYLQSMDAEARWMIESCLHSYYLLLLERNHSGQNMKNS